MVGRREQKHVYFAYDSEHLSEEILQNRRSTATAMRMTENLRKVKFSR